MLVYGCCVGASGKFENGFLPSLRAREPDALVLTRRYQRSIFEAYNSLLDEASALSDIEAVVLVHDDVEFRDDHLEETLRGVLADPSVGLVGVVGGVGQREMSWWNSDRCVGHVEHATHTDEFTHGVTEADAVDGLLMAVRPEVARSVRMNRRGYPAFHGYDGELCSLVRASGWRIVVADIDVFHNCKPGPWGRPEYGQALLEWQRRWVPHSSGQGLLLSGKRSLLAVLNRCSSLKGAVVRR